MKTAPLFIGKRIDNGDFVCGSYVEVASEMACINRQPSKHLIVFQQFVDWGFDPNVQAEVDPSTVEQIGGDLFEENKRLRDATDNAPTSGCAYRVCRQWGTVFYKEAETAKEAWDAVGELRFGEGFEVRDELGHIRPEFIPF